MNRAEGQERKKRHQTCQLCPVTMTQGCYERINGMIKMPIKAVIEHNQVTLFIQLKLLCVIFTAHKFLLILTLLFVYYYAKLVILI